MVRPLFLLLLVALSAPCLKAQTYDAEILGYEGLLYTCDGEAQPILKIINNGTAAMSGCVVHIWKSGVPVTTFDWQLAVPALQGEARTPAFPAMPVEPGDMIEFHIMTVNEVPDEVAEGNVIQIPLSEVPATSPTSAVKVEVMTGDAPEEITWTIRDKQYQVVASGGPYVSAGQTVNEIVMLDPTKCYGFEVKDAGGNGLDGGYAKVLDQTDALVFEVDAAEVFASARKGLVVNDDEASCPNDVVFETHMPGAGTLPVWEARSDATHALLASGGGGSAGATGAYPETFCLPDGDHYLVVDGVVEGATYKLYGADAPFPRILDNTAPVAGPHHVQGTSGVQLPVSDARVLLLACDKYWWKAGDYLVANEDPAVAAYWNGTTTERASTGYDFWFYDPNGGYSHVRQRRHNQADGYANVGSARTCHMRVNSTLHGWTIANHIPNGLPLNVRVRAVVNGVPGAWGPACRFTRDEAMAACPPTTLWRVPATDPKYSCDDATRNWNTHTNQRIFAHPVSGASQYTFRFENVNEEQVIERTVNTYYLNMGWNPNTAPVLGQGSTYRVTVRANKGGTLGPESNGWCVTGDPCTITICGPQGQGCSGGMIGGGQNNLVEDEAVLHNALRLWPNPNNGELVNVSLALPGVADGTVAMDILDLSGKLVTSRTLQIQDGQAEAVVDLGGGLSAGAYLVRFIADGQQHMTRLAVQP